MNSPNNTHAIDASYNTIPHAELARHAEIMCRAVETQQKHYKQHGDSCKRRRSSDVRLSHDVASRSTQ